MLTVTPCVDVTVVHEPVPAGHGLFALHQNRQVPVPAIPTHDI